MIKYSINIITYNRLDDLKKTLSSILKQIDDECEIVLVDNSPNLETRKYIEQLQNPAIKYFKNDINRIAVARNIGIKNSKGKYIVSLDDDCIAHSKWFENIKKCSIRDAVIGKVRIPKSTFLGDSISALGFPAGGNLGFEKMWKVDQSGHTSHLSFCNCIFRKKLVEKVGNMDENFRYGAEDTEFARRLAIKGYKIKYVPEITVFHKPRKDLMGFIRWHLVRGRSNYYLKKKVKKVGNYIKLRIWSSLNILKANKFNKEIVLIPFLLGFSFALQEYGYFSEKIKRDFWLPLTKRK